MKCGDLLTTSNQLDARLFLRSLNIQADGKAAATLLKRHNMRDPLPEGTEIMFDGLKATVVYDEGGKTLKVRTEGEMEVETWQWVCEGVPCTIISAPKIIFPPELLEVIESAPCTCPNPGGDWPCSKEDSCYRIKLKKILLTVKTNANLH